MSQQTDQRQIYELVQKLETDVQELKQILGQPSRRKPKAGKKQREFKSLYGVFPRTKITLSDFHDARQSWSNHLENF